MDAVRKLKKDLKPLYDKAIKDFNNLFTGRLAAMRELIDPHNVKVKTKLTQRATADLLGILPQNFNRILKGKKKTGGINPSVEQLIKMSIMYGCSLDYLILGKESSGGGDVDILKEALETERAMRKILQEENAALKTALVKKRDSRKKYKY